MIEIEPPRSRGASADEWAAWGISRVGLVRFVRRAQTAVGLNGEVSVLLAGDARLRRLNREFRGKDKATDVLSFPSGVESYAGDLAVSLETAARQAKRFGHTVDAEVRVLLLHGLLHLAGMDHEVDRGEMAAREAELREQLRLPVGLIGRVEMGLDRAASRRPSGVKEAKASSYELRAKSLELRAKAKAKAGSKEVRGTRLEVRVRTKAKETAKTQRTQSLREAKTRKGHGLRKGQNLRNEARGVAA